MQNNSCKFPWFGEIIGRIAYYVDIEINTIVAYATLRYSKTSTINHASNSSLTSIFIRSLAVNSPTKHNRQCMLCVLNYMPCPIPVVDGIFTCMSHQIGTLQPQTYLVHGIWTFFILIWVWFYTKPSDFGRQQPLKVRTWYQKLVGAKMAYLSFRNDDVDR